MKNCIVLVLLAICGFVNAQDNMLWYTSPAKVWNNALPVGNGRMGAMVFGDPNRERIQLNEESLWAGTRVNDLNPGSKEHLKEIQQLLLQGRNQEAYQLTKKHMLGIPPVLRSYQTLGDLFIDWDSSAVEDYTRKLDLASALHTTTYKRNGAVITETVFISAPDDIMVVHIKSSAGPTLNGRIRLQREKDALVRADGNSLIMEGQIIDTGEVAQRGPAGAHMRFAAMAYVDLVSGTLTTMNDHLVVKGASEILLTFTAKTDYNISKLNHDPSIQPLDSCINILKKTRLKTISYSSLLNKQLAEYKPLFAKASITLGEPLQLPTDQRLKFVKDGNRDNSLVALYFQYGRYMLLASSRYPAKLPANLQGKWNHLFDAPWNADYHTNINLQMNYWPSDLANVSSTFGPLANFLTAMLEPGINCARTMYGVEGWAMHHGTDIFGRTSIMDDPMWGTSPLAGAWMALNLYDHYDYTRDADYLKKVYPLLKGSTDFIMNFLIDDGNGQLVTAPSMSPENSFYLQDTGKSQSVLTYAPAIDIQIIRELFAGMRKLQKPMNIPTAYIERMNKVEAKIPPTKINAYGGIQEWVKDYREVEPGHRHMSHLFGLYPGTSLTRDPALMKASRTTIEHRLANGGGHTGWSRAWMINFFARLKDGEQAYYHIEQLLRKSTIDNLFDDHPPFQIDGNFGGTAGIAEMLVQSHNEKVEILPAIPSHWTGEIKGLKVRGGAVIDIKFQRGQLVSALVQSDAGVPLTLTYKGKSLVTSLAKGKSLTINSESFK
jgi:alpha-L-fucosidase 2